MQIISFDDLVEVNHKELDKYFSDKTEWPQADSFNEDSLLEIDMSHFKRISDFDNINSSPISFDSFDSQEEISQRPSKVNKHTR